MESDLTLTSPEHLPRNNDGWFAIVCVTRRKKNLAIAFSYRKDVYKWAHLYLQPGSENSVLFGDGKVRNCVKGLSTRDWAPVKTFCHRIKGWQLDHKTSNELKETILMNDQVGWKRIKNYRTVNRRWSNPCKISFPLKLLATERQLNNCKQ